MKTKPLWVSTKLDPQTQIDGKPIKVSDKTGRQISARLMVEKTGPDGKISVFATYNTSPYPANLDLAMFYLNQDQMEAFEKFGEFCILDLGEAA